MIDVRNAYESDIGRFGGQADEGGAELLVPDMRKSTDFPDWIEREETKEKLQGNHLFVLLLIEKVSFLIARYLHPLLHTMSLSYLIST